MLKSVVVSGDCNGAMVEVVNQDTVGVETDSSRCSTPFRVSELSLLDD